MNTVTIPKEITKGEDLVVMPRKDYEEFLGWQKIIKTTEIFGPPRKFKTYKPTAAELKELKKAREEHKRGEYVVIKNRAGLERELGITFKRAR